MLAGEFANNRFPRRERRRRSRFLSWYLGIACPQPKPEKISTILKA
jgi:hypothetical protein